MPELEFTESELEAVTMVFKQYETGLREACIDVKVGPIIFFCKNKYFKSINVSFCPKNKFLHPEGPAAGAGEPRPEHDGTGGD